MSAKTPRRGAARILRPLVLVPIALGMLVATATVLYWFGGPERPATAGATSSAVVAESSTGGDAAESSSAEDAAVSGSEAVPIPSGVMGGGSGEAPEGGVVMPLIPIPGCKCHSDDPAVVEEHAQFTLADCAECH